jgi:hypothetical protein
VIPGVSRSDIFILQRIHEEDCPFPGEKRFQHKIVGALQHSQLGIENETFDSSKKA